MSGDTTTGEFMIHSGLVKRSAVLVLLALLLQSCASKQVNRVTRDEFNAPTSTQFDNLNQDIANSALFAKSEIENEPYVLGRGDKLELTVFRVDELNAVIRINAAGDVILPLLGRMTLGGLTVPESEALIAEKLKADYLQDPQVSIYVEEYRSQEITVMGRVKSPNIYSVERPRSVMEMLSLAGGVDENAAETIRVSTKQLDAESGEIVQQNFLLNIRAMLSNQDTMLNLRLSGGDAIFVPEAGVVYVEGAVSKPGPYKISGKVNVLQALSMAGGPEWAANQDKIRIIREINKVSVSLDVNLAKIREQREKDVVLKDGDIIVVGYNGIKRVASQVLKGVNSIVGFGYTIN